MVFDTGSKCSSGERNSLLVTTENAVNRSVPFGSAQHSFPICLPTCPEKAYILIDGLECAIWVEETLKDELPVGNQSERFVIRMLQKQSPADECRLVADRSR